MEEEIKEIEKMAYEALGKKVPEDGEMTTSDYMHLSHDEHCFKNGYIQGALARKAIDDTEKQALIDKACEAFCNNCCHNQPFVKCRLLDKDCPLKKAFRKDLENR